jgi:hypothetical protein
VKFKQVNRSFHVEVRISEVRKRPRISNIVEKRSQENFKSNFDHYLDQDTATVMHGMLRGGRSEFQPVNHNHSGAFRSLE